MPHALNLPHPVEGMSLKKTTRPSEGTWDDYTNADLGPSVDDNNMAPSVTVFTNIAGAVSVTVDRESSISAGCRMSSKLLPENVFNPFRNRSNKRQLATPREKEGVASDVPSQNPQNPHVTSAAAAAIAVEGIKKGVREALDRWALQTSRRESMLLWRHECSRYASSSRIGYHPNHPSASHPSSRPSSAATIIRPLSAGRVLQQPHYHHHQRASSALPPRSLPLGEGRAGVDGAGLGNTTTGTRPRTATPRLGEDTEEYSNDSSRPKRGASASAARDDSGADGRDASSPGKRRSGSGSGSRSRKGRAMGSASTRSRSPMNYQDGASLEGEEGDELFDDIYEDLDEDDGELEARISIMESRFSTVGRERPGSAVDGGNAGGDGGDVDAQRQRWSRQTAAPDAPRSAATQRPPRAPTQQQQQQQQTPFGPRPARRQLVSSARAGATGTEAGDDSSNIAQQQNIPPFSTAASSRPRAPRVIKSRPTSAPVGGSSFFLQHQRAGGLVHDPMAPLHARRMRLQISSAGAEESRLTMEREQGGASGAGAAGSENQQRRHSVRDVTTALPSWDRASDSRNRPLSSATDGASRTAGGDADGRGYHRSSESASSAPTNSRPSSAAFRSWIKARPGARSAVSAVSSARTLGMDDPELVHLQLEMESRRGGMSEATLARMEVHYTAVVLKNSNAPQQLQKRRAADKDIRGRPTSPRKKGGRGSKSPRKKGSSKGARKGASKSRSKSPRKRKGGRKNGGRGKRGGRGGGGESTTAGKKVYTSAWAFMAEHFPSEESQSVSLLGMEQEEECQHASEALSRAGVSVSSAALRRALVIPTDRPLETCLAGLPLPMEGLRDAPFPPPAPLTTLLRHHQYLPTLLLSSPGMHAENMAEIAAGGLSTNGGGSRKKSPSPGRRAGGGGKGKKSRPLVGSGRERKKRGPPARR